MKEQNTKNTENSKGIRSSEGVTTQEFREKYFEHCKSISGLMVDCTRLEAAHKISDVFRGHEITPELIMAIAYHYEHGYSYSLEDVNENT